MRIGPDDIKRRYRQVMGRIRDFLLNERSREFFVFLVFVLIAGAFWLLQTLNDDYETEFSLPLRLRGVPDRVVITSDPPQELRVRVKDKGTVLLNYMLGRSFYPVTMEFAQHAGSEGSVRVPATVLREKVTSQLNASTQLLTIRPDTLEFYYSSGEARTVPVKLLGHVSAGRQYYLSDTIFTPDSVLVYAPREVLDTLTAAYTQRLNIEGISDTLRQRVTLLQTRGVKHVPTVVDMTLPVDIYTEKTIDVPIESVGFPTDRVLRAFPSRVSVTFQVGLSRFRTITAEDFLIAPTYAELIALDSDKYTVELKAVPAGVTQIRVQPAQVDFLIEQVATAE